MKRNHRHAEMIRRWLDDDSLEVEHYTGYAWELIEEVPSWRESKEYRFKPRMIKVNGHEFPEPMRVAPTARYWIPLITTATAGVASDYLPVGDQWEREMIKRGLCHTTQAAAEQHARALISLTEVRE